MTRRRLLLVGFWCMFFSLGCGGSDASRRHALRGAVVVEGTAVDKGTISFLPLPGALGAPTSTTVEQGEYRFPKDMGPFAGPHRVVIGIALEPEPATTSSSVAPLVATSSGIKVAPPPEPADGTRRGNSKASSPQTQWEIEYTIEEDGDDRKDFNLSG